MCFIVSFIIFTDHFNIYTREAGEGCLSVAVEGPSKAVMKLEERPHGFLGVSYKVEKPGTFLCLRGANVKNLL